MINKEKIEEVAKLLAAMPDDEHILNFYSFRVGDKEIVAADMYPPLHHPQTINFFFFVCLHQFGFWYGDDKGYVAPLIGQINGKPAKGSDLLWKVAIRALAKNETVFTPEFLAIISLSDFIAVFSDDNGPIPLPDFETRFALTSAFGTFFLENADTSYFNSPAAVVQFANQNPDRALDIFIGLTMDIPGYDQDIFNKKNLLLAMALTNRPEHFLLSRADSGSWTPVVDYHLMRLALRLGLMDLWPDTVYDNENRKWISEGIEEIIRGEVFDTIQLLIKQSGKSMSFVDHVMWSARRYCPEMEEPNCAKCIFNAVCAKRTNLFQPVFRTTAY